MCERFSPLAKNLGISVVCKCGAEVLRKIPRRANRTESLLPHSRTSEPSEVLILRPRGRGSCGGAIREAVPCQGLVGHFFLDGFHPGSDSSVQLRHNASILLPE
jgi:hypothetical protein